MEIEPPDEAVIDALHFEPIDDRNNFPADTVAILVHRSGARYCARYDGERSSSERLLTSIAVGLNNEVMTGSYNSLSLHSLGEFSSKVEKQLEERYQQAFSLEGPNLSLAEGTLRADNLSDFDWEIPRLLITSGQSIGINIGQSYIKFALVDDTGRIEKRLRNQTFSDPAATRANQIRSTTLEGLDSLLSVANYKIPVGVSVGSIVEGGKIRHGSGLTVGMSEDELELIDRLPDDIKAATGSEPVIVQDMRAKGYYHALNGYGAGTLILDVGTSFGGAYINSIGNVSARYNQVGRVVIDISQTARWRSDRQAVGVLSLYLSARGFVAELQDYGFPILSTPEIESVLYGGSESVELAKSRMNSHLAAAVWSLSKHYDFDSVILTGGLTAGGVFENVASLPARGSSSKMVQVYRSDDPIFDSAVGVAHLASRYR